MAEGVAKCTAPKVGVCRCASRLLLSRHADMQRRPAACQVGHTKMGVPSSGSLLGLLTHFLVACRRRPNAPADEKAVIGGCWNS